MGIDMVSPFVVVGECDGEEGRTHFERQKHDIMSHIFGMNAA